MGRLRRGDQSQLSLNYEPSLISCIFFRIFCVRPIFESVARFSQLFLGLLYLFFCLSTEVDACFWAPACNERHLLSFVVFIIIPPAADRWPRTTWPSPLSKSQLFHLSQLAGSRRRCRVFKSDLESVKYSCRSLNSFIFNLTTSASAYVTIVYLDDSQMLF